MATSNPAPTSTVRPVTSRKPPSVNEPVREQRSRTGAQPRAKTTNARSMQHMRRWGIADALRAVAPLPYDYPTDIVFATALFGRTLAVIENAWPPYGKSITSVFAGSPTRTSASRPCVIVGTFTVVPSSR